MLSLGEGSSVPHHRESGRQQSQYPKGWEGVLDKGRCQLADSGLDGLPRGPETSVLCKGTTLDLSSFPGYRMRPGSVSHSGPHLTNTDVLA